MLRLLQVWFAGPLPSVWNLTGLYASTKKVVAQVAELNTLSGNSIAPREGGG